MKFTHFNDYGEATMVDVTNKDNTKRIAVAEGTILMNKECYKMVKKGTVEKGDVLAVARIAGIMGAKKTSELIPLCHILMLTSMSINFITNDNDFSIKAQCTVKTSGKTGVEMEALTGVNVALLTIYDMCKAIDKSMEITNIHLISKDGGKSGKFRNPNVK